MGFALGVFVAIYVGGDYAFAQTPLGGIRPQQPKFVSGFLQNGDERCYYRRDGVSVVVKKAEAAVSFSATYSENKAQQFGRTFFGIFSGLLTMLIGYAFLIRRRR